MKFTEEQYFKIVKAYNDRWGYMGGIQAVIDYVEDLNSHDYEEAILLAIPKSREWAYDKFVEKEKRYIWKLNGLYLVKSIDDGSIFFGSLDASMALSVSQIKEWGFNPEMFDKEEVQ